MVRYLSAVSVLLIGSLTPSMAQVVRNVDRLVVVDAAGTTVGEMLSIEGPAGATVALEIDGQLVVLRVTRERFLGTADSSIVFDTLDCSGSPYTSPGEISFGPSLTAAVVGRPGATLYLGNPDGPLISITRRSSRRWDSDECNVESPSPQSVLPVLPVADLADLYEPPFHLAVEVTATATASPSPSQPPATPLPTSTPTAIVPSPACCGDCNGDGEVRINELIDGVNRSLFGCDAQ
jgi:hypothetical protein